MRLRFRLWAWAFDLGLWLGWSRLHQRAVQGMSDATDWGPVPPPDAPGAEVPF